MKIDQEKKIVLFRYGRESSFAHVWLLPLIALAGLTVILSHGMGVQDGPGYFIFLHFFKNPAIYTVDPLVSTFASSYTPLVQRLLAEIADIPFYHLLIGSITKITVVALFYLLAWRITHSTLASLIAVLIMFGLAEFSLGQYQVLNLRIPIGFTSSDFRTPIYLSYRLISMVFMVGGMLFFLERRFILCSMLLGVGFYSHAISAAAFFLSFCGALMIPLLRRTDRLGSFYALLKVSLPFILLTLPCTLGSMGSFSEVEPMDFASHWSSALINEPDDISTIWYILHFKSIYSIGFLCTVFAAGLHVLFQAAKPVNFREVKAEFSKAEFFNGDLILPLLFVPWLILLFGLTWEAALIPLFPDTLNDIVAMLNLKRITTVAAWVYVPILSILISRTLLVLAESICLETISEAKLERLKKLFLKIKVESQERAISILLVFIALSYILCFKNENITTFKKYLNFEHKGYEFFLDDTEPAYAPPRNWSGRLLPVSALLEVCGWVKKNTSEDAAIFGPSYIKRTRLYCERQGFLTEREDGTISVFNRKFATIYMQRFSDLHKGLTYDDLPRNKFGGMEVYAVLRERYLSLVEMDIESLKQKYPGYDYFMTETSHSLDYPILFENQFFRLYDISQGL